MSGMEIPLALVAIGGTAASTFMGAKAGKASRDAQLMAAREQSAAYEFEAGQLDTQGKRIRSAAAADEAVRRTDLESSLETIQVLRAGRGLDLDSPTGRAIQSGVTATAERNILQSRTNYLLQAEQSDAQAALARRKARYSLIAGDAGADAADASITAGIFSGIGRAASIGIDTGRTLRRGYSPYGYGTAGA